MMRSMMIVVLILIISSFGSLYAQGFYIGAGIGNTFYASEIEEVGDQVSSLDENATGYKFFGGFSTPTIFGIEGGYRNLGTITVSNFSFETKTTGWDVYGMARLEVLMIVDIFAKAGAFFWETENILVQTALGSSGTAFAWGLGAGVHLGPIGVRLEWENFQVEDPVTLSMISASATFGF